MRPMRCPDPIMLPAIKSARGVTLIELIVVIVVTGIIASGVAVFIKRPMDSYVDASRRATLSDEADTALRRITRDLRTALPNSVRVDASGKFIEYIETTSGGRYRADLSSTGSGDILDFTTTDTSFDVLGPPPATGTAIVVYNLFNSGTTSNAYSADNRTALTSVGSTVVFTSKLFPVSSPARRFHIVSGPVTYGCTGGQLRRYSGYAYNEPQVAPPTGGSSAVLAASVDAGECSFSYTAGSLSERTGTVTIVLQINSTAAGGDVEKVRMFQQVQIGNAP